MQDLRQKFHGHSWSCPKMPGTVWLHCFFFVIWNFFASPQCLFGIRGRLVHVGGWYICSDFLCMSLSLLSKSLEFHSSVFSFPVKINARVNQTSILVAHVQGYGFKFRLPCSGFETRMQAALTTHNTCITRPPSLHETSIVLRIACLIWYFTRLSRYIYLLTDSFPSLGAEAVRNCL